MTRTKKACFALVFLLSILLIAEGALRLFGFRFEETTAPVEIVGIDLTHHQTSQYLEPNRDTFWDLIPGSDLGCANGSRRRVFEQATSLGCRGWETRPEKPSGSIRIAALGDSCTFGFGENLLRIYPSRLEHRLRFGWR